MNNIPSELYPHVNRILQGLLAEPTSQSLPGTRYIKCLGDTLYAFREQSELLHNSPVSSPRGPLKPGGGKSILVGSVLLSLICGEICPVWSESDRQWRAQ